MQDHYKTLGLTMDASAKEVKKAFRALAKKYHPDRNAARSEWATVQMKRLLEANYILSDSYKRQVYDRRYAIVMVRWTPSHRRKRHIDETAEQAETILQDLLSGHEAQAIEAYETLLRRDGGFELSDHLTLRDWVDCKFLIAEQYQKVGEYEKALALYEELHQSEQAQKRYTHFMHEVRERMVHICCRDLAASAKPEVAVRYYQHALEIEQARSRRAFLHKKLAECNLAAGDLNAARRQLTVAFQLKPDLKGATKICQKLNFVRR